MKTFLSHGNRIRANVVCRSAVMVVLAACAGPNTNQSSVRSQVSVGEKFVELGEFARGYSILEQVAEDNRVSSSAALALAESYQRQGALMKAEKFYVQAIRLSAWQQGELGLARVSLLRNSPQDAQERVLRLLAKRPLMVEAQNILAVSHDLMGRHEEAQILYHEILQSDPGNVHAQNNLALSLALAGAGGAAADRLAELSRSHRDSAVIRQNLAIAQFLAGEKKAAMSTAMVDLNRQEAAENFSVLGSL